MTEGHEERFAALEAVRRGPQSKRGNSLSRCLKLPRKNLDIRCPAVPNACGAREFASVVLRRFCFVLERRDTSHCCLPNVSYCPPANVCLLSNAPPADWHVTQVSATPAFRKPCHAGEEPEPERRFQVPDPTIWDAKGGYSRFQLELRGTSTTFAEWNLSCRLMAVLGPFHRQCRSLTDQPFKTPVTVPAFRIRFQTCLSLESEDSCSTRQRVGWRDCAGRKVTTRASWPGVLFSSIRLVSRWWSSFMLLSSVRDQMC